MAARNDWPNGTKIATFWMLVICMVASIAALGTIEVDFVFLEDHPFQRSMEEGIRDDLAAFGITVQARPLGKEALNEAMQTGDFHMAFTESWGPPYDPHSYVASFRVADEAGLAATSGMREPMTKARLDETITQVLQEENTAARAQIWERILKSLHDQAIFLPISYHQNPAVFNNRLEGFTFGHQQFDYPMEEITVRFGSQVAVVSPGSQTGLFRDVGFMHPHAYRPNEFFANNWVYEGLVAYDADGTIIPALAESWETTDMENGQRIRFQLRQNVKFHDGSAWNASVAKLNFDHVLAGPLTSGDYHGWYELPAKIVRWEVVDDYTFDIFTNGVYYPLLQELSYIRPLRMLSPEMFKGDSPLEQNSCPENWGTVEDNGVAVTCTGILGVSGTGPWKFMEKVTNTRTLDEKQVVSTALDEGEVVTEVKFGRNLDHWELPSNFEAERYLEELIVKTYDDHDEVRDALLSGGLDIAIGGGPLQANDIRMIQEDHGNLLTVMYSPPLNTRLIALNSMKAPLDSEEVRKLIVHGVNKEKIIEETLGGLEEKAVTIFPSDLPYTNVTLLPVMDYDPEKAFMIRHHGLVTLDPRNDTGVREVGIKNCGLRYWSRRVPRRAVTLNQGATEVMLALGLSENMAGTAYIDDSIWEEYQSDYLSVPILAPRYPDIDTLWGVQPDFLYGSYGSAFSDRSINYSKIIGPCTIAEEEQHVDSQDDWSSCRGALHNFGIHTYLQEPYCETNQHRPEKVTVQTLFSEVWEIANIFNVMETGRILINSIVQHFADAQDIQASAGSNLPELDLLWLDSWDDSEPFVGACCGSVNLIIENSGAHNTFDDLGVDTQRSWERIPWEAVIERDPDIIVLVDAVWDTADSKLLNLCNKTETRAMRAVQNRQFIVVPFSGTTLGVRIGAVAYNLAEAMVALARGVPLQEVDFQPVEANGFLSSSGVFVYENLPEVDGINLDTFCPGTNTISTAESSNNEGSKSLSGGAIAGIVIGCVAAVAIALMAILYVRKRSSNGGVKWESSLKSMEHAIGKNGIDGDHTLTLEEASIR